MTTWEELEAKYRAVNVYGWNISMAHIWICLVILTVTLIFVKKRDVIYFPNDVDTWIQSLVFGVTLEISRKCFDKLGLGFFEKTGSLLPSLILAQLVARYSSLLLNVPDTLSIPGTIIGFTVISVVKSLLKK